MDTSTWLCGPPPTTGQRQRYPSRFINHLKRYYPYVIGPNTLHMFSGSSSFGITTDMRPETGAQIICDFHKISDYITDVDHVIADPPYADYFQKEWGGELPKPKHILQAAASVVKENGLILILHIIVIPSYKELHVDRIALHPILAGPNNAMRVLNVFRKNSGL